MNSSEELLANAQEDISNQSDADYVNLIALSDMDGDDESSDDESEEEYPYDEPDDEDSYDDSGDY